MRTVLVLLLATACGPDDTLTVLHTNDWQSHMLGQGPNAEYTPETTGDDDTIGGLARMQSKIEEIRDAARHPVVLYDGGDWMGGALFQALATSHAAELTMMEAMGYDAVVIGNHELDWGPNVLGQMISTADEVGVEVTILATNLDPDPDDPGDADLRAHFDSGRVVPHAVMEHGRDLRIGLLGLIGHHAWLVTAYQGSVTFRDPIEAAQEAVDALKAEDVDLIFALTHAGVAEDMILADAVDGIDVIVGGHSHTALYEEIVVNGTTIVQAGAYTHYLGQIDLERSRSNGWDVVDYRLHRLDDTIPGHPEAISAVDGFTEALAQGPLAEWGLTFDEPILSIPDDVGIGRDGCDESPLGHFITDAYRDQVSALVPEDPIDVAFEAHGVIRSPLVAGNTGIQAFSDIFRALPLGGHDGDAMGYPLTSFWVTGRDLATACEITATVAPETCTMFLELSGMRCTVDMDGFPTFRTTKVELWNGEEYEQISVGASNTTLYHATTDLYSLQMIPLLEELTGGQLRFVPKDSEGQEVTDLSELLVTGDGDSAYRMWEALLDYAATFPDTDGDGLPNLPEAYLEPAGRYIGWAYPEE